jgi:hypothetical protein
MKTVLLLMIAASALMLFACGTTRELPGEDLRHTYEVALRSFEADFQPSDYAPTISSVLEEDPDTVTQSVKVHPNNLPAGSGEVVLGYRVQVFSTTDFTTAKSRQTDAQFLFPGDRVYLVYEPPTYKIRVGDFLARFEADQFQQQAAERGFPNAWVVPEKIYKNTSPPAQTPPQKEGECGKK